MDGSVSAPELGEDALSLRDKIVRLEAAMLEMPQLDIPILHHFAPGVYMREMRAPEGATITGLIHKTEHYCILAQGEMTVSTDDGVRRICAPAIVKAKPGTKRVAYCHSDVVWINVHPNPDDDTDVEEIAQRLVTNDFEDPELIAALNPKGVLT